MSDVTRFQSNTKATKAPCPGTGKPAVSPPFRGAFRGRAMCPHCTKFVGVSIGSATPHHLEVPARMSIPQENAKTNREARGNEKRRSSFENEVTRELREIGKVTGRDMSRAIAEVQSSPDDYSESTGMTASEAASLALEVTGLPITGAEVVMSEQRPGEASVCGVQAEDFEVAKARLEDCRAGFAENQNNFAGTVARRELLQLCIQIADEFGGEIRKEPIRLGRRMIDCSRDYDSWGAALERAHQKVQP